jgi:hypothetical protein
MVDLKLPRPTMAIDEAPTDRVTPNDHYRAGMALANGVQNLGSGLEEANEQADGTTAERWRRCARPTRKTQTKIHRRQGSLRHRPPSTALAASVVLLPTGQGSRPYSCRTLPDCCRIGNRENSGQAGTNRQDV